MSYRYHYIGMLAFTGAFIVLVLFLMFHIPSGNPYVQFFADYSFGFMRRALVGEILSYFFPVISPPVVWYTGVLAIALAAALYLVLLRRDFGITYANLPFIAFVLCSPFFFKTFARLVGFFDIYGFIVACAALLVPARWFYPVLFALASMVLILVHHIHFLLYVPVISFICVLRYSTERTFHKRDVLYLLTCALAVCCAFLYVAFYGSAPVPQEILLEHMRSRGLRETDVGVGMWYRTISEEMRDTAARLPVQALFVPLYLLVLYIHLPLGQFLLRSVQSIQGRHLRIASFTALYGITLAYVPIFVVIYDYNRWLSNWAVCMLLALHAIRRLPSTAGGDPPVEIESVRNLVLGWMVTLYILTSPTTPGIGHLICPATAYIEALEPLC